MNKEMNKGFIALFSVIIISAVLLLMASSSSLSGFFLRLNTFDLELKKQSEALARACLDTTILKIIEDSAYTVSNECVSVEANCPAPVGTCTILRVENSGGQKTITTRGIAGTTSRAYTYYQAKIDPGTLKVTSFQELESYP